MAIDARPTAEGGDEAGAAAQGEEAAQARPAVGENIRCFLAAHLSTDALRALAEVQRELHERCHKGSVHLRWVPVENLHITLRFFADLPLAIVPAIERELGRLTATQPPVPLDIVGVGAFPNLQSARVLWAGLREDTPRIASLQRRIEDAMETLGFPREERPFVAHLTLARARSGETADLRDAAAQLAYAPIGRTLVREIIVYESVLGPAGARYTPLRRCRFDESAAPDSGEARHASTGSTRDPGGTERPPGAGHNEPARTR